MLNVALAGLTSATVSPGASRFGLIVAGAAVADTPGVGNWVASDAIPSDWTKRRRFMGGILSRPGAGGNLPARGKACEC